MQLILGAIGVHENARQSQIGCSSSGSLALPVIPVEPKRGGPYIEFQLDAAGCQDERLFDPSAVARIADYSGGIPRLVNAIATMLYAPRVAVWEKVSQELIDESL